MHDGDGHLVCPCFALPLLIFAILLSPPLHFLFRYEKEVAAVPTTKWTPARYHWAQAAAREVEHLACIRTFPTAQHPETAIAFYCDLCLMS